MNKKILTVLLVLAMMLSMVAPVAVFAEGCEHKHQISTPTGNGTHMTLCLDCEAVIAESSNCTYENGYCTACGAIEPDVPAECKHASVVCTDNGDGTHKATCSNPDCDGYVVAEAEPHKFDEDGVCEACGAKKPCDHVDKGTHAVDNGDQTHSLVCDECGAVLETGPCYYVDGVCPQCGSEEPAKCEHTNKAYTVVDEKTHQVSCADCGETLKQWEAHDFVDGVCKDCGFEEVVEPCKHEHTIWVWNEGDGTHYLLCEDCADILTDPEACTYEDGVCTVCGGLENTLPDPDLDDVPKTGSFFLEWLYSVIF